MRCVDWRRLEIRRNFPSGDAQSHGRERTLMNCCDSATAISSVFDIVLTTSR